MLESRLRHSAILKNENLLVDSGSLVPAWLKAWLFSPEWNGIRVSQARENGYVRKMSVTLV